MESSAWSAPVHEVHSTIAAMADSDRRAALATVVAVEGSAYRRPGAKAVIKEGGDGTGTITTGCLEDEVVELASKVIESGKPTVVTYDLMDDDDVWGLGVGCNGITDILLEPLDASFEPVASAYADDDPVAVVTAVESARDDIVVGNRTVVRPDGSTDEGGQLPISIVDAVADAAADLATNGKSRSIAVPGELVTVFVDGVAPLPVLAILGTGHDVVPLVECGKRNGFRVQVIGFRGGTDLATRFPKADGTGTTRVADLRTDYTFDERTYAVVMSHNFVDDRFAVAELLKTDVPYLGLMGPRERFEEILESYDEEQRRTVEASLGRVYTPVGLDLGGGSPHQIATSVVAEALAVHNDRTPGHLKAREGPIHDRVELGSTGRGP
ncbi:XdhC family protein [Halomarina halobia]|uniref:XdhC family protein n=1 Tax=Halomarina halobia TaxID=3033386 RepID=A0ABD6AFP9_9EURY|nr:XdhC/CoxI family protein [Halomarina sp. PSR21]